MINPGTSAMPNAKLPTSSGVIGGSPNGVLSTQIFAVNGFTLTVGLLLLLVAGFLVFNMFFARRRR